MLFWLFHPKPLNSKWLSKYICRKYNGKHHIGICIFDEKKQNQNPVPLETTNTLSNNKNNVIKNNIIKNNEIFTNHL